MRYVSACLALLLSACGKEEPAKPLPTQVYLPFPDVDRFALDGDPGEALSVSETKEKGSGEEVVVEGRISNIVKGITIFNLVDEDLYYCGKGGAEDKCKTPWDYCCVDASERAKGTLAVEMRGPDGKPIRGPLTALRLLDLVAVKGKVEKDEHGNVTVVATGWFRRERPELPDDLHWPE
ncbi:MAG: hypothetical protein L6Q95_17475 [Planctomycetes bacterium]|nr:hypothetical protein [Planctomycetota bacterium]